MRVNDVVRILANDENLFVGELGKILNCAADGSFLVQVIGKRVEGMPVWVWFMPNELVKA
jgi:hypothetical protein